MDIKTWLQAPVMWKPATDHHTFRMTPFRRTPDSIARANAKIGEKEDCVQNSSQPAHPRVLFRCLSETKERFGRIPDDSPLSSVQQMVLTSTNCPSTLRTLISMSWYTETITDISCFVFMCVHYEWIVLPFWIFIALHENHTVCIHSNGICFYHIWIIA